MRTPIKRLALVMLLVVAAAGLACQERSEVEQLKTRAEQGDATAQYILGTKYRDGEGVSQDYGEAEKWYRRAAEQGHAEGVPTRRRGRWHGWAVNQILSRQRGKAARS